MRHAPIGIFDSGYGGLTVFKHIRELMPQYEYIYLGDNARNPYGTRSFDVVYQYTLEAVEKLFSMGCELVILACNTASAKALRTIQKNDLPRIAPNKRVLGVIRPSVEEVGLMQSQHVGVLGTSGTVKSHSYSLEIEKLFPHIKVTEEACPMWVPLVENREYDKVGADYYVKQHIDAILQRDSDIDTLILGCTHYPLLLDKIRASVPESIAILSQGTLVAKKLKLYLNNHPEMEERCSLTFGAQFYTTESPERFKESAEVFLDESITFVDIEI
jgi:glutamate racemase